MILSSNIVFASSLLCACRMGKSGRVTTIVGAESEQLVADTIRQLSTDESLDSVFSRRRSYRKGQKKRLDKLEAEQLNEGLAKIGDEHLGSDSGSEGDASDDDAETTVEKA